MNKFKTTKVGKTTSVIVGLATAAWLSVGSLVVPMTTMAQTTDETIALLLKQIADLQAQLTALQGGTSVSTSEKCAFTRSLTIGSRGEDVTCLQKYLQSGGYFTFSGGATGYFGSITRSAVAAWQAANGVSPAAGYFGSISRAKYNVLVSVVSSSVSSVASSASSASSVAVGGLTISAATQPAATLAVKSAARVPFTKITLTAGNSDVTVTGVNVERTGLANDAAFSGIVLLDENSQQVGIAKTFNSDHKAVVGETFTVKAGQSRTLTIAGNMAADETNYAGQVAYLTVNGISTSATVSGSLPITGAGHTINNSLTIGTITVNVGSIDPISNVSKEVGTTAYTFTSVRLTAGSAEKIRVHSIRWNQSGSAASSDLENVKTYADGVAYDTVVSSDGKYYTSIFGNGIVVDKGNNIELSVKGDIKSGSGRGIDFDVYKTTDLYLTGETYGYGITPPNGTDTSGTDDSAFHESTNPWFDASEVTVAGGSLTVGKATTIASQNIAENVSGQPLGGFTVEAKGEAISVSSIKFRVSTWAGTEASASTQDITNITLSDENGTVVAGPIDIAATSPQVNFTDTVTFPVGIHTYTLKGKIGADYANNDTVAASTTPSSDWTSATGQQTGNSITVSPTSVITGNTMTVKSAVVTLSVSTDPVAQTVVAGAQNFTFANYIFDASASGEDIKFSSLPLAYDANGGNPTNITGCALFDGSTQLNTGSNVVNPTADSSSTTFTLDSGLTIPKQTVKTITMKCNIAGTATSSATYSWGYDSGATPTATGMTSGQTASVSENDSVGQVMTISGNGTLTVELDSSSPSYNIGAAGSTVTLGVLKFNAANEAINLKKVALQIDTASSSVSDLSGSQVTLWDEAMGTQIGSATFVSANATGTLTSDFIIPKDGYKRMILKGTLSAIGTSQVGTQGALAKVNYDGGDSTGTQGVGASSGATINQGSTSDTAVSGTRVFRSYPTLAKIAVPSTSIVSNETGKSLYRFSVKANSSGDVGLYQIRLNIATSASPAGASSTVTNLKVFAYSDSGFSTTVNGFNPAGQLNNTIATLVNSGTTTVTMSASTQGTGKSYLQIPAGATYYFDVKGDVTLTGSPTAASIITKLKGDTAYPPLSGSYKLAAAASTTVFSATTYDAYFDNFIWSPNATTTSLTTHEDWTSGYFIPGLPSTDLDSQSLSK